MTPLTPHASRKPIGLGLALLPILVMVGLFAAGSLLMEPSGELIVMVMIAAAAAAGIVAVAHGATWSQIQQAAGDRISAVLPALIILLLIGLLIATWVISGTIPFLVYWGVRLVDPRFLVVTAFLACVLMSSFTGTSWGSAATIGVAMMGTAVALHAPMPLVAGAVISGAYFGDKMSPLSDTTIIASVAAEVDIYEHIRHLLYTAVPSFVLALLVYGAAGLFSSTAGGAIPESGRALLVDIEAVYSLSWLTLLPPLTVIVCIARRVPAAIAIGLSSLVAAVIGVAVQHFSLQDVVVASVAGFRLSMIDPSVIDTAAIGEAFGRIVERGGLYSMSTTLVMVFAAFLLAAGMEVSGALDLLISRLLASVRSTFALIAATMTAGLTMVGLTSHGGVTMLVVGGMFQRAYRERGLAPHNLSRSLEDSVSITEVLMPWTVSAVFMATTLGVSTVEYAPFAVFCYSGPFFSLLIAALHPFTGYGIRPLAPALVGMEEAVASG